jgi:hypothetical protein
MENERYLINIVFGRIKYLVLSWIRYWQEKYLKKTVPEFHHPKAGENDETH